MCESDFWCRRGIVRYILLLAILVLDCTDLLEQLRIRPRRAIETVRVVFIVAVVSLGSS